METGPHGVARWLAWPSGILRLAVALLTALALAAAAWLYPGAVRDLGQVAETNSALSFADRDVGGGNSILPQQQTAYELRGRIPEGDRYHVIVGEALEGWPALTVTSIDPFLRFWLLPRRVDPAARWIVCVGCDPATLGDVEDVWSDSAGVRLLRRRP
jgi:hypothetical protein